MVESKKIQAFRANNSYCGKSLCEGFTLIEVLIVIGIFAVISAVSFATLTQYISVNEKLEKNAIETSRLQKAFTLLERDLRYMVDRTVRDEYGDTEGAFITNYANGFPGEQIRFTTIHPDYALPNSGRLQRVVWRLDNSELFRDNWNYLDRDLDSPLNSFKVLSDVSHMDVEQFRWTDTFGLQQGTQFTSEDQFPYAVRITLSLNDGKEYMRLFDLANGT